MDRTLPETAGSRSGVAIFDSAGVGVRVYDSLSAASQLLLRGPRYLIGGRGGFEFERVIGAVRHRANQIVVGDYGRRELLVFDTLGAVQHRLARYGAGPGEFRELRWLGRYGDTVVAYDGRLQRLSFFADSQFQRSLFIQRNKHMLAFAAIPVGVDPKGRLVLTSGGMIPLGDPGPARRERENRPLVRYTTTGYPERLIASIPGTDFEISPITTGPAAGSFQRSEILFGNKSAAVLVGDKVIVVDGARFELHVLDQDGRVQQILRRSATADSVGPADIERLIEERVALAASPEAKSRLRNHLRERIAARTFPLLDGQLHATRSGRIWLGEYRRPGFAQQRWWIWSLTDVQEFVIDLPARLAIADVGDEYVLAVLRDEDGVEAVALYDVIPRR